MCARDHVFCFRSKKPYKRRGNAFLPNRTVFAPPPVSPPIAMQLEDPSPKPQRFPPPPPPMLWRGVQPRLVWQRGPWGLGGGGKSLASGTWGLSVGNQPAPYRALSGPPGPKCRKSLENVSRGLRPRDPKKSQKSLGDSPGSLRRVSGKCLESVF